MPIPIALIAAAAPSIIKGISGLVQSNNADKVKVRDTTPDAFKESLALTRQGANTSRLPGEGLETARIAQQTAGVNAAALRAGGSSADVLASLAASDAQSQQALAGLSARGEAYQQQQQGQLRQGLAQQAAYQSADQQAAAREAAALKEAGAKNMFSAAEGLSQVGTYTANKDNEDKIGSGNWGLGGYSDPPMRRRRNDMFGLPIPSGLS